ncbi:MAG: glutamate mutase L [Oscillospiraceae bacterium]|nr:glutamate mutase L [Oscillospiraceae bacterium]
MKRLFFDFGSTFTKAVLFDIEKRELLAHVQTPSTVGTDVTEGLFAAIALLRKKTELTDGELAAARASSSAAGGLKIAAVGLVPDYTTKAAKTAALGSGGKVTDTFSFELTNSECRRIEESAPDVILLCGGTDGGNKTNILANAKKLAELPAAKNIIVCGNKSARDEAERVFADAKTAANVIFTDNVMPEFGVLNTQGVSAAIRELFISRITQAKGIDRVKTVIRDVVMPTPAAVMGAVSLLSRGVRTGEGFGELMAVDLGGATTDVYSVADGLPQVPGVHLSGLAEPREKRTVEGDLGLYHNLDVLAELAGEADEYVAALKAKLSIPDSETADTQLRLSRAAVRTAVQRHCGTRRSVYTADGTALFQTGKDLTNTELVIGTGGPIAFSGNPGIVLSGAVREEADIESLMPKKPGFLIDREYILFAVGLLGEDEPEAAFEIGARYLERLK